MNDVADSLALFRQMKASVRGSEKYLLVGIDVAKNKHHAFFGTHRVGGEPCGSRPPSELCVKVSPHTAQALQSSPLLGHPPA